MSRRVLNVEMSLGRTLTLTTSLTARLNLTITRYRTAMLTRTMTCIITL